MDNMESVPRFGRLQAIGLSFYSRDLYADVALRHIVSSAGAGPQSGRDYAL
jgi:hypothetical protein